MIATTEALTEQEQQALEHVRKSQELGVTLKEYAARLGTGRPDALPTHRKPGAQGSLGAVPNGKDKESAHSCRCV